MDFYITVLLIAILLLILILTYIGIIINNQGSDSQFPPLANTCPDYWVTDSSFCYVPKTNEKNTGIIYDEKKKIKLNKKNTFGYNELKSGSNIIPRIDFNAMDWTSTGTSTICAKKQWANNYGIIWDGVSNFNKC